MIIKGVCLGGRESASGRKGKAEGDVGEYYRSTLHICVKIAQ
jgi:hypothetical protein